MNAADPVVLIHGAWQGSWVWRGMLPLFARAGLSAVAVDLPGNGSDATPPQDVCLGGYLSYLEGVLVRLGRPASLVAHSGGGVVASALAERCADRVTRIAYVAGMMLPSGMGFADLIAELRAEHPEAAGIGPHLVWSADRVMSSVPAAAALAYFFHDCADTDARDAAARLTPQPEGGRALCATLTPQRFGRMPRLYVEAAADRSVVLPCQRRMQDLVPGAQVVTLPTGHAPHLAAPALLAEALIPFLAGTDDGTPLARSDGHAGGAAPHGRSLQADERQ